MFFAIKIRCTPDYGNGNKGTGGQRKRDKRKRNGKWWEGNDKVKVSSKSIPWAVSHLSLLYFCFLSKFYFALYLLYWSQKLFKKRIRCLSKKPMMHTKASTHLTNSADTSGRFRPTTDICIRYQTVLFDFDHWRSFSDGSVRPWTFTFVFLPFHPISKTLTSVSGRFLPI